MLRLLAIEIFSYFGINKNRSFYYHLPNEISTFIEYCYLTHTIVKLVRFNISLCHI